MAKNYPSDMIVLYCTLVRDHKCEISDIPASVQSEVAKWLNYFETGELGSDVAEQGGTNDEDVKPA
jgi:hypothetical protein